MRNAKFAEDLVQAAEEWCQEQGAELLEEVGFRAVGGGVAGVLGMEKISLRNLREQKKRIAGGENVISQ